MTEVNTDLVKRQLSELAEQSVHVIQAYNKEKAILEEDFDCMKNGIIIMESCLLTEKIRIDSEVQGVGSMMQFQQAMLEELHSGIHVLQEQDNQIVGEATDLFAAIRSELEAQSKKITDNGLQIFAQRVSIQAVRKSIGVVSNRIDEVNKVLATITESLKMIPSKRELRQHQVAMDELLIQIVEINTELTTGMEQCKFSESMPFDFGQNIAGPSGTQPYIDPR
jgi:predicted  nucleic acid-binding Zn-ribbon protein